MKTPEGRRATSDINKIEVKKGNTREEFRKRLIKSNEQVFKKNMEIAMLKKQLRERDQEIERLDREIKELERENELVTEYCSKLEENLIDEYLSCKTQSGLRFK